MDKLTIDAKNKKLGRVATEAASFLLGKTSADYQPNVVAQKSVEITNASKLEITEQKSIDKKYKRYSGYPGGQTEESLQNLAARKGHSEIVRKAVYNMLPGNKLRKDRMKNLVISE